MATEELTAFRRGEERRGGGGRDRNSGLLGLGPRSALRPSRWQIWFLREAGCGRERASGRLAGEGDFGWQGNAKRGQRAGVVTFQWAHGHWSRPIPFSRARPSLRARHRRLPGRPCVAPGIYSRNLLIANQELIGFPDLLDVIRVSPSGHYSRLFFKYKRQIKDSIIQYSIYKYRLLINTEVNALQHRIDRIDDEFVQ